MPVSCGRSLLRNRRWRQYSASGCPALRSRISSLLSDSVNGLASLLCRTGIWATTPALVIFIEFRWKECCTSKCFSDQVRVNCSHRTKVPSPWTNPTGRSTAVDGKLCAGKSILGSQSRHPDHLTSTSRSSQMPIRRERLGLTVEAVVHDNPSRIHYSRARSWASAR